MTIQSLFNKLSKPNEKRVAYGIYWSINKMYKIDTKATYSEGFYTFTQWVSFKEADFIITKLDGFDLVGRNTYEAKCIIDALIISVKYFFGMRNGNANICIEVIDRKEAEEKKKIENENKESLRKIKQHMMKFIRENKNITDEQYNNELSKFDEKYVKILQAENF
jgi:hypothetical protein